MKKEKKSLRYAGMLARYLGGEMSETESHAFEAEFIVSEEEKLSIEKMKKQWTAMEGYEKKRAPQTGQAWEKLHNRLQEENLIPQQHVAADNRFRLNLVRVAAVAILLLGSAVIVYLSLNRKPAVEMVQLNTGNEASTLIKTLADGSVIYIAQNSLFSFPDKFESTTRNVALKGEAFFDINPNPGKPFIIETDEAVIQVLGTAFNVKTADGRGFELAVNRGKVKVTLKADPSHSELVVAGEKISTSQNRLVKSKHAWDEADLWYRNRMHFKDEKLENIIRVLNRNFNTTFVLADNELGKHRLTVAFHNESAETMSELICVTLNLKSQTINGSVVLSENKEGARQN